MESADDVILEHGRALEKYRSSYEVERLYAHFEAQLSLPGGLRNAFDLEGPILSKGPSGRSIDGPRAIVEHPIASSVSRVCRAQPDRNFFWTSLTRSCLDSFLEGNPHLKYIFRGTRVLTKEAYAALLCRHPLILTFLREYVPNVDDFLAYYRRLYEGIDERELSDLITRRDSSGHRFDIGSLARLDRLLSGAIKVPYLLERASSFDSGGPVRLFDDSAVDFQRSIERCVAPFLRTKEDFAKGLVEVPSFWFGNFECPDRGFAVHPPGGRGERWFYALSATREIYNRRRRGYQHFDVYAEGQACLHLDGRTLAGEVLKRTPLVAVASIGLAA